MDAKKLSEAIIARLQKTAMPVTFVGDKLDAFKFGIEVAAHIVTEETAKESTDGVDGDS